MVNRSPQGGATRQVYLDNAATTKVRREVAEAMVTFMTQDYGNPSSIHSAGRTAREAMEVARANVARLINARPSEIIFTSGGTEADNLAILGVGRRAVAGKNHIITSQIEHHAVLHTCEYLEGHGFTVTYLPVDADGMVDPAAVREAITPHTALVTIMHANNEVGTIEPVETIGSICRAAGVPFHTDAVQSAGKIPIDVQAMNVDLLTLSAHKMYGPKGAGALYVRRGIRLEPQQHGGAHERKLRAGTENVPGIVGLGVAAGLAADELPTTQAYLQSMRDALIDGLLRLPNTKLNGHRTRRLPHNVNVSFRDIEGESILLALDMMGIAASTGSACSSGSLSPSHVLLAMGNTHQDAQGSIRMTLGRDNQPADVEYVVDRMGPIIARLRMMSPLADASGSGTGVADSGPSGKSCGKA